MAAALKTVPDLNFTDAIQFAARYALTMGPQILEVFLRVARDLNAEAATRRQA